MNINEISSRLAAAGDDPQRVAVVTLDILLESKSPSLRRAVEAACIPHWFDARILTELLDDDLKADAVALYHDVIALPFIEVYQQAKAHNVHESTRLGMRRRLLVTAPERLTLLSRRAVAVFNSGSVHDRIERVFHEIWAEPEVGGRELRQLERDLRHRVEDGLALAKSLREILNIEEAQPLVQAWAAWLETVARAPYLRLTERLLLAQKAFDRARDAGSAYAIAATAVELGGALIERAGAGDAASGFNALEMSLQLREQLLAQCPETTDAARDVSVSLNKLADFLARRGQPGDAKRALRHYERGLEISERLLVASPESAEAAHNASVSLIGLADFLTRRGQPGDAKRALRHYERSLEISERLLAANPESAQAARTFYVSSWRVGDFLAKWGRPGDAETALKHLNRCLEVCERLLAANPESAQAAREVAVSLDRLGGLLASRGQPGDAERALGLCERSLEVRERLLAINPDSAEAAREVAVSLDRLGHFLARRGLPEDAERALGHYERSREICERLLSANPESAQAVRDAVANLIPIADFLVRRGQPGDAERALVHYERSREVCERLLTANPESAQTARDVSVSLMGLAGFLARRGQPGDAERALGHYERCHDVLERVLNANPESAQAARDVSVSLNKLADLLARRGQPGDAERALGYYQRCQEVFERLLAANSESGQAARDVSVTLSCQADFLARRGQPGDAEQALGHYQRSLEVRERILKANPESAEAMRDLLVTLERLARFAGNQPGGAAKALELQGRSLDLALKLRERNPKSYFHQRTAAGSFALMYQRAHAAGQQQLASKCREGCFTILDDLVKAGVQLDPEMAGLYAQLKSATAQE